MMPVGSLASEDQGPSVLLQGLFVPRGPLAPAPDLEFRLLSSFSSPWNSLPVLEAVAK